MTWLIDKIPSSSNPDQTAPDKPGQPGEKPAPGKPDAEGDKPSQAPVEHPVNPGKPGESRQEIKSVPSGATEKGDNVSDFIS
ncbi:hypothetical protein [Corynebacterium appendicis]|uniref:hypothetical protein n=1 Tax=Corynebacterium appendicis TaxID=163202 RepID=UPI001177E46A|nr:hypothetical protein [Corynebacterium appendicis]